MPNSSDQPTWLLSAEHGALGEARAKALLLERFWVLERSVDVHGADLLLDAQDRKIREDNLKRYSWRLVRDPMSWIDENLVFQEGH